MACGQGAFPDASVSTVLILTKQNSNLYSIICVPPVEASCEYPPAPTNGAVSVTQLGVGGLALYNCNPGLSLLGSPSIVCQAGGKWSGVAPTCIM